MEESYAVGVKIALGGDIGVAIQKVIGEFAKLDAAVNVTQGFVRDLNAGMKALTLESGSAIKGWTGAASAMDRAAAAAQRAAAAWRSIPAPVVPAMPGAQPGQAWRDTANAPPSESRALVPYQSSSTDYTLQGRPYTAYGGYGPSRPMRPDYGVPAIYNGTGPNVGDFTLNGGAYDPRLGGVPDRYLPPDRSIPLNWQGLPQRDRLAERMGQPSTAKEGDTFLQGATAYLGADVIKRAFENAGSAQAIIAGLAAQNWTPAQQDAARKEAFDLQRTIVPSTVESNLGVISGLYTVLQDATAALRLAPDFAKLSATLSPGQAGSMPQIMAAIRAGELKGVLGEYNQATGKYVVSADQLGAFVNDLARASALSHGQVGPQEWYSFLKSSGTAGAMTLTGPMFTDAMALIMSMGPTRAGTALQGFSQQFSAGKMSKGALKMLSDMKIVTHPEDVTPLGYGQYILKPGAMPLHYLQDARDDPAKFVFQDLLPKVQRYLHKSYGADYDNADQRHKSQMEQATLQQIASRIPGGNYMADIVRNFPIIERDRAAFERMPGADQIYATQVATNPELHAAALNSALTALSTTLGSASMGDSVRLLDRLTASLNAISSVAEAHQQAAGTTLDALAAGSAGVGLGVAVKLGTKILGLTADLGPLALVLGTVAAATAVATKGFQWIDHELQQLWPSFFIGDKGIQELQNRRPQPPPGPRWYEWMPRTFGHPAAPTARQSFAPPPTSGGSVGVHLTQTPDVNATVVNGHDLASGVGSAMSGQMNRPPGGYTGYDVNQNPWGAATFGGAQ